MHAQELAYIAVKYISGDREIRINVLAKEMPSILDIVTAASRPLTPDERGRLRGDFSDAAIRGMTKPIIRMADVGGKDAYPSGRAKYLGAGCTYITSAQFCHSMLAFLTGEITADSLLGAE